MLAFDEKERKHAFGAYSGCPCRVQFDADWSEEFPRRVHPEYVEELKRRCEKYSQKDEATYSNWDRGVKMPYGEWQYYECSHDVRSCRFSLREEKGSVTFRKTYNI